MLRHRDVLRLHPRSLLLLLAVAATAHAVEVESDVAASDVFLYTTTDVRQSVGDSLAIGAGYLALSDWQIVRHGARASLDVDAGPATLRLLVDWGPRQEGRGWLSAAVSVASTFERDTFSVDGEATMRARRVDVAIGHAVVPIDQLQLELDGRVRFRIVDLGVRAIASSYDPDVVVGVLARGDAGLLVTIGGRPERWALAGHVGVRPHPRWRGEISLAGVAFADGRTGALVPRAALTSGPWGWLTVEVSLDCAFPGPRVEPPAWVAGAAISLGPP